MAGVKIPFPSTGHEALDAMLREAKAEALEWAAGECQSRYCDCGPEPFNRAADFLRAEARRLREGG